MKEEDPDGELSREFAKYSSSSGMRFRQSGPVRHATGRTRDLVQSVRSVAAAAGALPVHGVLAALLLCAFAAQSSAPRIAMATCARANAAVRAGQWHRLVTSTVLHGGGMHLASNLFSLWRVGPLVQASFGPARAWLLYLTSGIGGSVAGLTLGSVSAVSVGASGAVFGLMGSVLGYVQRNRRALGAAGDAMFTNVLQVLLLNLFIGLRRGSGVDNLAHLGGFASGAVLGYLTAPGKATRGWRGEFEGNDDGLLPNWAVSGLLAAAAVCYALAMRDAWRLTSMAVKIYGRR